MLSFVLETLGELRETFEGVQSYLNDNRIGEDNAYDVRLTIFELCGNILRHSNCPCKVTLELTEDLITIQIESEVAFSICDACGTLRAESGRGVFLIRNLVRSLQYFDCGKNIRAEIDRC